MTKHIIIALDIDGVLNCSEDHKRLIQNETTSIDFYQIGDYINIYKLNLLNSFIMNMLSKNHQVTVLGISSWFSSRSNLHDLKSFFKFSNEVDFLTIKNTAGVGNNRFKQVAEFIINNQFNQDVYLLYLDDTKVEQDYVNGYLEKLKDSGLKNHIIPTIDGTTNGISKLDWLNMEKVLLS